MQLTRRLIFACLVSLLVIGTSLFGCSKNKSVEQPAEPVVQITSVPSADKAANWPHLHDIKKLSELYQERFEKEQILDTLDSIDRNDDVDEKYKNYYDSMKLLAKTQGYEEIPGCHAFSEAGPNDVASLESVMDKIDLNAKNEAGNTVLHSLVSCHGNEGSDMETTTDLDLVYNLLDNGADITKIGSNDETILMMTHFLPTAEKFIKAKGDVNAQNKYGETALYIQAIYRDKMSCENFFYEEGTMGCIDGDEDGSCKTHADLRRSEMVSLLDMLISAGADVNAKDHDGVSPVMISSIVANNPKANLNDVDALGRSVLMHQIAHFVLVPSVCSRPSLNESFKIGVDVNYINHQNGFNALVYAVELRRDLFEYKKIGMNCLEMSDCIMTSRNDETLLNPSIAGKYLSLKEVNSINAMFSYDTIPSTYYKDENNISPDDIRLNASLGAIELLLKAGADVNIKTKDGKNAIMERVSKDDKELVELLHQYGL